MKQEETNTFEKLHGFAQAEIDRVSSFYRNLIWALSLIIAVGLVAMGFLYVNNMIEIKDDYKNKIDLIEQNYQLVRDANVAKITNEINEKIEIEFNVQRISELITTKTNERVTAIADNLIKNRIDEKVQPIYRRLQETEALTDIKIAQLIFDYYVLNANNDSKVAFIALLEWSQNESYKLFDQANKEISIIIRELDKEYHYPYLISQGFPIENKNLSDLQKDFVNELRIADRSIFIKDVMREKTITNDTKTELFLYIIENSISLRNAYLAAKNYIELNELDIIPYHFNEIIKNPSK